MSSFAGLSPRRSLAYARLSPQGHPCATASSKVTVTEEAMRVVSDALQLFGGNGLTREYPMEKLFRDARAALIEDGENMMLTTRLGFPCPGALRRRLAPVLIQDPTNNKLWRQ